MKMYDVIISNTTKHRQTVKRFTTKLGAMRYVVATATMMEKMPGMRPTDIRVYGPDGTMIFKY